MLCSSKLREAHAGPGRWGLPPSKPFCPSISPAQEGHPHKNGDTRSWLQQISTRLSIQLAGPSPRWLSSHSHEFETGPATLASPVAAQPRASAEAVRRAMQSVRHYAGFAGPTNNSVVRESQCLEVDEEQKRRAVRAGRPHNYAASVCTGKMRSQLAERWTGYLDDPEKDTEMTPDAALMLLSKCEFFDARVTERKVRQYLRQVTSGSREAVCIAPVIQRVSERISPNQFTAMLMWIACLKGITYAECVSKLVSHPGGLRTKIELYFSEFGHGAAQGLMTVYEFTRFCSSFGLFQDSPERFVEGDVHFLFLNGGEGKAVDLRGFRRLLLLLAQKLELKLQDLLHRLAQREIDRHKKSRRPRNKKRHGSADCGRGRVDH